MGLGDAGLQLPTLAQPQVGLKGPQGADIDMPDAPQRRRKGPTTALSTTNEMRPVPIRPKRLARSHNRRPEHAPRGAPGRPRRT